MGAKSYEAHDPKAALSLSLPMPLRMSSQSLPAAQALQKQCHPHLVQVDPGREQQVREYQGNLTLSHTLHSLSLTYPLPTIAFVTLKDRSDPVTLDMPRPKIHNG